MYYSLPYSKWYSDGATQRLVTVKFANGMFKNMYLPTDICMILVNADTMEELDKAALMALDVIMKKANKRREEVEYFHRDSCFHIAIELLPEN